MKWLDLLHARYHNDGLFFRDGFGDPSILKESLVRKESPALLSVAPFAPHETTRVLRFLSPRADILPAASKVVEASALLPRGWTYQTPLCVQLAATGDEGFLARQKVVSTPLQSLGIGSVVVENPYYGCRRPHSQIKTYLNHVSDLWSMGLAIVAEARAIVLWLRSQGFQNLAICGVSMGGAMASQAVALTPFPVAMVACIAPHCASPVFTEDVLSNYVDWEALGGEKLGKKQLAAQLSGSDLRLFPQPQRPDCALWLSAKRDAYVTPASSELAAKTWPNSKHRWLNNGHVGTTLFHRNSYLQAISEAFKLLSRGARDQDVWLP